MPEEIRRSDDEIIAEITRIQDKQFKGFPMDHDTGYKERVETLLWVLGLETRT